MSTLILRIKGSVMTFPMVLVRSEHKEFRLELLLSEPFYFRVGNNNINSIKTVVVHHLLHKTAKILFFKFMSN